MRILLVTPAPRGSRKGNRVTALRWTALLRRLGHHVVVRNSDSDAVADTGAFGRHVVVRNSDSQAVADTGAFGHHVVVRNSDGDAVADTESFDLLIALHARRSAAVVGRFARERPEVPRVVTLTGTDIYGDLAGSAEAHSALALASRLVVLQPLAARAIPPSLAARVRVILQSSPRHPARPSPIPRDAFIVCVLGHLRRVKDPLRTAAAARLLPPSSRLRVVHVGGALPDGLLPAHAMAEAARAEERENARYTWLGERPRAEALALVAASDLLVLTSTAEGGANAISEAITAGVPVLSSRIDGSVGLLGPDYPGYFPVGDTLALASLLDRCERDPAFLALLRDHGDRLLPLLDPARELAAWASLLEELFPALARPAP